MPKASFSGFLGIEREEKIKKERKIGCVCMRERSRENKRDSDSRSEKCFTTQPEENIRSHEVRPLSATTYSMLRL